MSAPSSYRLAGEVTNARVEARRAGSSRIRETLDRALRSTNASTKPPYHLAAVMRKADTISQAQAKLNEMTGLNVDWEDLGVGPPNEHARKLALKVLDTAYAMNILEPTFVTATVDGGVGIVYKRDGRYAAVQALNDHTLWLLWFDDDTPRSEPIKKSHKGIQEALARVAALHENAG